MKWCGKCRLYLNINFFSKNQNRCKKCQSEAFKIWANKNKNILKVKKKLHRIKNKNHYTNYDKNYYSNNRRSKLLNQKIFRKINQEHVKIRDKKYYDKNKFKIAEYNSRPDRKKRMAVTAKRRRQDPIVKLRSNVSRAVWSALRNVLKTKNNCSCVRYLPYSILDLKKHLESQFEPWMNWSNYGKYKLKGHKTWHIDHIIPQSKLPYDSMDHPNFKKCWALINLRPLEASKNISKGNK